MSYELIPLILSCIRRKVYFCVPLIGFFILLTSCSHKHNEHPEFFSAVIDHAAELRMGGDVKRSFQYEDSVYAAFPNPGIGDIFRRYEDRTRAYFYVTEDFNSAMAYTDSMLWILEGHEKEKEYAELYITTYLTKSNILFSQKKYRDSYAYYFKAKALADKTNPDFLGKMYYAALGHANYRFYRYADAAAYLKRVLNLAPDSIAGTGFFKFAERESLLDDIGIFYEKAGKDDSAKIYYLRAFEVIEKYQKLYPEKTNFVECAKGILYGNLSGPVYREGDVPRAEALLKQSIRLNLQKEHENRDAQTALIKLAKLYLENEEANKVPPVLDLLKKSLDSLPDLERKIEWMELTSWYYEQKNDINAAFLFAKKNKELKHQLEKQNMLKKSMDVNEEFEAVHNESKLEGLKKQNERNSAFLFLTACIAILALVIAVLIWRYWKQSKKSVSLLTLLNNQIHSQNDLLERSVKLLDVSQSLGQTAGWEYNRQTNEMFITRQTYLLYDLDDDFVPTLDSIRALVNDKEKNMLDGISSSISEKKQHRTETEIITRKNIKKWVRIIAEPLVKDGNVIGSIGAIQDITLEKAAEQAQSDLTRHLQTLISSLEDIIFEIDGNRVYRNVWVKDDSVLFLPKDQLIGKSLAEVFGPFAEMFSRPVDEVLQTGVTTEFEYKHIDPAVEQWFKAKITLMHKAARLEDSRVVISVQDISARTRQDQALKEAKDKLERVNFLLDVSQSLGKVGGWEFDLKTQEVFMTQQAYVIYGVGSDFVPTFESTTAFFDEETRDKLNQLALEAAEKRLPYDVELQMFTPKNGKKWVRIIGVPVIRNDDVVGLRGAILDITEEKESELSLIGVKEKLEQSILDKDRIMQVLVHDLRSPLSGIHSVSEMMLRKTNYSRSDFEMLSVINNTSLFLFEMVNDLVGIYLSGESTLLKKEGVSVQFLVQQSALVLKHKANEKSQQIHLHLQENTVASLDAQKILRVLNNLLGNAIKFSPKDSVITVAAKMENGMLQLSVEDHGIGIPPDLKDKVFDVFTEAKRYGTNSEQPFGLGLSISKRIVEAHGGRIWFESEPGKTTIFFIEIPADPA